MKQFRVKQAFGTYNVGDLISPTGLYRDHLQCYDYIENKPYIADEVKSPVPEEAPEETIVDGDDDEVIDDIDEDDDTPLIETATAPQAQTAELQPRRGRGRPRRV